ncbi:MAG TPA: phosphoribosylformylglycinamidine synthase subunit PurQ [Chitinophagales bacterium]
MKFGVVVFPGSNCDRDMVHVLRDVMGAEVQEIFHKETSLEGFSRRDCIIIPGGFSYGDYLRTGAIARFSPIMNAVIEFANNGGRVFGICNGFQILCEAGLLPGALLRNTNMKYNCRNIFLKTQTKESELTRFLNPAQTLKIPIAHGEGRYYCDEETLKALKKNNQILFKYSNADGVVTEDSNPNGSIENIAGICNAGRNVFGMMPHPERASEADLSNTDGYGLFASLINQEVLV